MAAIGVIASSVVIYGLYNTAVKNINLIGKAKKAFGNQHIINAKKKD